jgi:hypothetical protein
MAAILTGLTDDPNQEYPITLPDGSTVTMDLQYWPQQNGWYYDLSWDGQSPPWQLNGMQLVANPNILRQWKNVIPFGLTVGTLNGQDPTSQEDFVNGNCTMILLNASDVAMIESTYFPGLP